ncbi:hypothetical protein GCM10023335_68060 [Streptomyces siamensis]|uniref:Uncharacterized protein n=1 Tax=Streptomyces siamensis TaxID=1274986 RepID=A0ABP9JFT7_9ACTN
MHAALPRADLREDSTFCVLGGLAFALGTGTGVGLGFGRMTGCVLRLSAGIAVGLIGSDARQCLASLMCARLPAVPAGTLPGLGLRQRR